MIYDCSSQLGRRKESSSFVALPEKVNIALKKPLYLKTEFKAVFQVRLAGALRQCSGGYLCGCQRRDMVTFEGPF